MRTLSRRVATIRHGNVAQGTSCLPLASSPRSSTLTWGGGVGGAFGAFQWSFTLTWGHPCTPPYLVATILHANVGTGTSGLLVITFLHANVGRGLGATQSWRQSQLSSTLTWERVLLASPPSQLSSTTRVGTGTSGAKQRHARDWSQLSSTPSVGTGTSSRDWSQLSSSPHKRWGNGYFQSRVSSRTRLTPPRGVERVRVLNQHWPQADFLEFVDTRQVHRRGGQRQRRGARSDRA